MNKTTFFHWMDLLWRNNSCCYDFQRDRKINFFNLTDFFFFKLPKIFRSRELLNMHWNNFEKGGGLNRDDEVKNALTESLFFLTFYLSLSFSTSLSLIYFLSLSVVFNFLYHSFSLLYLTILIFISFFSLILKLYSFLLCSSTLIRHSPAHTNSRAHPNTNTRTHSHSQTSVHTLTLIFPLSALYLPSKPLTPYPAQPSFILQCFKSVFFPYIRSFLFSLHFSFSPLLLPLVSLSQSFPTVLNV